MQIVITGAAGFLGRHLARALLRQGALAFDSGRPMPLSRLTLIDVAPMDLGTDDARVERLAGSVADARLLAQAISAETRAVFHLAALTSGAAERDFDAGVGANLDGTRAVLEACRALPRPARLVFASSIAVYGGALPPLVPDDLPLRPQLSYGTHKAIGELMVADYSRKGFLDGRSLRLPTILVREGSPDPQAANSDFVSALLREPLAGRNYVCPLAPETPMTVLSTARAVASLIHSCALPAAAWGEERSLMLPTLDLPLGSLAEALRRVAGAEAYRRLSWRPDPAMTRLVAGWPKGFAASRARALGFTADSSAEAIVAAYLRERRELAA